jgi:hypothetical protein
MQNLRIFGLLGILSLTGCNMSDFEEGDGNSGSNDRSSSDRGSGGGDNGSNSGNSGNNSGGGDNGSGDSSSGDLVADSDLDTRIPCVGDSITWRGDTMMFQYPSRELLEAGLNDEGNLLAWTFVGVYPDKLTGECKINRGKQKGQSLSIACLDAKDGVQKADRDCPVIRECDHGPSSGSCKDDVTEALASVEDSSNGSSSSSSDFDGRAQVATNASAIQDLQNAGAERDAAIAYNSAAVEENGRGIASNSGSLNRIEGMVQSIMDSITSSGS